MALLQWNAVDDYLSSRVSAAQPIAVGKAESLGRHASSAGAAGTTDHGKTAQLFPVAALYKRRINSSDPECFRGRYSDNRRNIASICERAANVIARDAVLACTSRREALIFRFNTVAPAPRKSARVRVPISAGKTVAARMRRCRMAREYCIPASTPCSALSSHFR